MKNVMDFGAKGDGLSDDRPAFQAALDAAVDFRENVLVPRGRTFKLSRIPGALNAAIRIPPGRSLVAEPGDGARPVLFAADENAPSVHLIHGDGPSIAISDLILSGGTQSTTSGDEHRHGIYAVSAPGLEIRNCAISGFSGDGIYINAGSDDIRVIDTSAFENGRNGATFGGGTRGALIDGCLFFDNRAQQLDSEPAAAPVKLSVDGVRIINSHIKCGTSTDYSLVISGCSADALGEKWLIEGCDIEGPVLMRWVTEAMFTNNTVFNAGLRPAVTIDRRCMALVGGNVIVNSQETNDGQSVIWMTGTSPGNAPTARIVGNVLISSGRSDVYGVRCTGIDSADIAGNDMSGPSIGGAGNGAGIYVRATMPGVTNRVSIMDNLIKDWSGFGVRVAGNGAAEIRLLRIIGNRFSRAPDAGAGIMRAAMDLDDGTGCARDVVEADNEATGCTLYNHLPAYPVEDYGRRWRAP